MIKYSILRRHLKVFWLSPIAHSAQGRGASIQYTFMLFSVMFGIGSQDTQHRNLTSDTYKMLDLARLGIIKEGLLDVDYLRIRIKIKSLTKCRLFRMLHPT